MQQETKKIVTHFISIFTLLQWSETKPTISLRHACILKYLQTAMFAVPTISLNKWMIVTSLRKRRINLIF